MRYKRSGCAYPVGVDPDGGNTAISRLAAGRKRYNARRKLAAIVRQAAVVRLLSEAGPDDLQRGFKTRTAKELGVDSTTITRDLRAIRLIASDPAQVEEREYPAAQRRADRWWTMLVRMGLIDPNHPMGTGTSHAD